MIARMIAALAIVSLLCGCAGTSETSSSNTSAKPNQARDLPPPPPGTVPSRITIAAEIPVDTNADGAADTINIFVYLWADPVRSGYPLPMWADGSMMFSLMDRNGDELARWNMPSMVVEASRTRLAPGPAHFFSLSLLEAGSEPIPPQPAELHARFTTPSGDTAVTYSPASFDRLGR